MRGLGGVMVTLNRARERVYRAGFGTIPLSQVAISARPMDCKFIDADKLFVTKKFRAYAAPLVGELPVYASLKTKKAKKSGRGRVLVSK